MYKVTLSMFVVCSMHTGGKDIGELAGLQHWIFKMEEYTVDALRIQILKAL